MEKGWAERPWKERAQSTCSVPSSKMRGSSERPEVRDWCFGDGVAREAGEVVEGGDGAAVGAVAVVLCCASSLGEDLSARELKREEGRVTLLACLGSCGEELIGLDAKDLLDDRCTCDLLVESDKGHRPDSCMKGLLPSRMVEDMAVDEMMVMVLVRSGALWRHEETPSQWTSYV